MRKKRKSFLVVLSGIVVLFAMALFPQDGAPKSQEVLELADQLELTEQQVLKVEEVFKMSQNQAARDRENFKGSALALIEAARRRRWMTDSHIESILESEQMEKFDLFKKQRRRNEEFFLLKEGLLLTEEQENKVKEILDDYRERAKAERESSRGQMMGRDGGMPGGGGGGMGGGMPGGGGGGMGGGMPGGGGGMHGGGPGGGMHDAMMEKMKSWENKKAKEIKKILTKVQQEMYKDIREMQEKEMEKRFNQQKEQFKGRGRRF